MTPSLDRPHNAFIKFRDSERAAKRNKDHVQVVALVEDILALANMAPSLGIATEFFWKDLAAAQLSLGDRTAALQAYERSREVMLLSRNRATPDQIDGWDKELAILDRKIQSLRRV